MDLAEQQLGVVSRQQLRALGVTRDHERSQVEAQRWSRATPRVMALLTGALDREQWMWVAQLHSSETSKLFGETALEAQGLAGWEPERAHVLVAHGLKVPPAPSLVVHHSRSAGSEAPVIRRGLRCEPAARAVVSAVNAIAQERRALGLVLATVQQRIAAPKDITRRLHVSTRHVVAIRRILGEADAGADSLREVDLVRLLRRAGFTSYRRQVMVRTMEGPRRFDVGVELADGSLLLTEVDGVHHLEPHVREADATKDAEAAALGHRVMRIPVHVMVPQEARLVQQFSRIRVGAERRTRRW